MVNMIRVIMESPFMGQHKPRNVAYALKCLSDCIERGESPYASHLLYTQVLDDDVPEERELGFKLAEQWYRAADKIVVYEDFGVTSGMEAGMVQGELLDIPIERRKLFE
tara:strand:- start:5378 stop:5704 length:327 start_codon:yes stop_codon:yes gene_type:complete